MNYLLPHSWKLWYHKIFWWRNAYLGQNIFSKEFVIQNWRKYIILYIWLRCFKGKYCYCRTSWWYKGFPGSEFTNLLCCGKFSHSLLETFEFSCVVYYHYKNVNKACVNCLIEPNHANLWILAASVSRSK